MIWKTFPVNWDSLHQQREKFWEWWESLLQAKERDKGEEHVAVTVNLLWHIWKAKNNSNFNMMQ